MEAWVKVFGYFRKLYYLRVRAKGLTINVWILNNVKKIIILKIIPNKTILILAIVLTIGASSCSKFSHNFSREQKNNFNWRRYLCFWNSNDSDKNETSSKEIEGLQETSSIWSRICGWFNKSSKSTSNLGDIARSQNDNIDRVDSISMHENQISVEALWEKRIELIEKYKSRLTERENRHSIERLEKNFGELFEYIEGAYLEDIENYKNESIPNEETLNKIKDKLNNYSNRKENFNFLGTMEEGSEQDLLAIALDCIAFCLLEVEYIDYEIHIRAEKDGLLRDIEIEKNDSHYAIENISINYFSKYTHSKWERELEKNIERYKTFSEKLSNLEFNDKSIQFSSHPLIEEHIGTLAQNLDDINELFYGQEYASLQHNYPIKTKDGQLENSENVYSGRRPIQIYRELNSSIRTLIEFYGNKSKSEEKESRLNNLGVKLQNLNTLAVKHDIEIEKA